jgi:hypothetical protein
LQDDLLQLAPKIALAPGTPIQSLINKVSGYSTGGNKPLVLLAKVLEWENPDADAAY